MLHNDGSIDFIGSDVCYCDTPKSYSRGFDVDVEELKVAFQRAAEEINQSGDFNHDALLEALRAFDIAGFNGTVFFSENGDNHLCWKTSNDGYDACDLKFIGDGSRYSSFINISDTDAFEKPETIKIITAIEE